MLHQLLILHPVYYIRGFQVFLIYQILHNVLTMSSQALFQLIKSKSRYLQKLRSYFNETTTFVLNLVSSFGLLPITFALYLKDLFAIFLLLFISLLASTFLLASSFISALQ